MAENEICLLTSAIDNIDAEISQLYLRRSQYSMKLNTLRSATRQLPSEILTEILRLSACKPNLRELQQLYYVDITSLCVLNGDGWHGLLQTYGRPVFSHHQPFHYLGGKQKGLTL
jgi:hypothetical protein